MDLIDRQAAIEAMMNASTPAFDKNGKPTFLVDYVSVMQNLPSAEPKTGHWIKISPAGIYECSQCGQNVMTGDIEVYAYCHYCGAYMKEENDETD